MARGSPQFGTRRPRALRRRLAIAAVAALAAFALAQVIPYGRGHADPRPPAPVALSQARAIFASACADCHSDKTRWPWYSNVAPVSWLVQHDVDGGRGRLNLSDWDAPQPALSQVVRRIQSGSMPPIQYKVIHSDARLSAAQKAQLVAAFRLLYEQHPPARVSARGGG